MMLTQKMVTPICKQIATEHEGWEYTNFRFKKKIGTHSVIAIVPLWYHHLAAQPVVWLYNKNVKKLYKTVYPNDYGGGYPISQKNVTRPDATLETQTYSRLVHTMEEAEEYIRDFFARGLDIVHTHYNYEDEQALLENMPEDFEDQFGVAYALTRVYLHDFDFAWRYVNEEIETVRPKHPEIKMEIRKMLPIWEKNYQETGSVFGKKSK